MSERAGEFLIHLTTGERFWTSGYRDVLELHDMLIVRAAHDAKSRTTNGWFSGQVPRETFINPFYIVCIEDLR